MEKTAKQIAEQTKNDIVRSILSLTIPSNWTADVTTRYIVNYISSMKVSDD
jgi:hypothetical protein